MSRYVLYTVVFFFFFWAIISVLTTPLFFSPANALSETEQQAWENVKQWERNLTVLPNLKGEGKKKKKGCLLRKLGNIPGYSFI